MTFRVVRTNQYNQDLGLIHSTNRNHLESPNEGSSIDHQVPDAEHSSTCCCPTHEVWELPSPLKVANRSQQGDEVTGVTRSASNKHLGTEAQTLRTGRYALNQCSDPSNTTEGSKRSTRLQKGDVFAIHLQLFPSLQKRHQTKRLSKGVQRYHSYFSRIYLPLKSEKIRTKLVELVAPSSVFWVTVPEPVLC
ncbi:hypothetical protein F511_21289 [Dorcoceras hygrometricum]|uniref:Uncharacterized protein n=1 Tax=Dorcoceras hygrometricum TaxID=472368 RepID=A0A2Z7CGP9_9LAMI|nr:hypothetical protein F511_21289 [Dorcoceras hygrometricum]